MSAVDERYQVVDTTTLSNKIQELLSWDLYKSNENFKNFVSKNGITHDEVGLLIDSYKELEKFYKTRDILSVNESIINRALEIKNRSNNSHALPMKENRDNDIKSHAYRDGEFETLEFRGDTIEYFKIWIVNIFLNLVTVGIYSAWAKVRTNRYFYANTYFQNSSFEYSAKPLSILKGRLIVVAFYAMFIFSSQVILNPAMTLGIFVFALLAAPWLISKAVKFKLKTIKHRNINFRYDENAPVFYKFFFIHMLINLVTVGLAYPYSLNEFKKLLIDNSKYGGSSFSYSGQAKGMYMQYLKIIGSYIGYIVIPFVLLGVAFSVGMNHFYNQNMASLASDPKMLQIFLISVTALTYMSYLIVIPAVKGFYDAYIANFVWQNSRLEKIGFKSTLKPTKLAWIYISNVFAIIFSFGLLYPWTKVRVAKYKCENFAISATDMSNFIAVNQKEQSAIGEEVDDFFDIDIGF